MVHSDKSSGEKQNGLRDGQHNGNLAPARDGHGNGNLTPVRDGHNNGSHAPAYDVATTGMTTGREPATAAV